jgi:predicted nucleic acid-binding protein
VLAWARKHTDYEAILDDRAARNCALSLGIPVRGTLGVILLAKREGLLSHVQPVFARLQEAGLRIAPVVLDTALELAGEKEP